MYYQLRGGATPEKDTGELIHTENAEEALDKFLSGAYWKLSFGLSNGEKVRLVKENRNIEITYPREMVERVLADIEMAERALADIIKS